jgi:imidazolonepropionase
LADEKGSLEIGKDADILVLNVDSYQQIPYWFGFNPVETVVVKGESISHRGTETQRTQMVQKSKRQ